MVVEYPAIWVLAMISDIRLPLRDVLHPKEQLITKSEDIEYPHMKFMNDPDADAMLTKEYRKPFVVPDKV